MTAHCGLRTNVDKTVYTNNHVLAPNFDLAQAADWAAQYIASALGDLAVKNHQAVDWQSAEKHGFRVHSAISGVVEEGQLKDVLKDTTKQLLFDLYGLHAVGNDRYFLAFAEQFSQTKRFTNHATGYAGNVIARVVWEGGTQGLHLSVQVSTRSNRNAD